MPFLASIKPLLKGASEVTLKVFMEDGQMSVVVMPRIEHYDADTKNPVQAALQSALVLPFHFRVAEGIDPDQALAEALESLAAIHAPVVDQFARHREEMAQASSQATAAAKAASAKAAKPTPKTPAKTPAKPGPDAARKGNANDAEPDVPDSTEARSGTPPAAAADLFSFDTPEASSAGDADVATGVHAND